MKTANVIIIGIGNNMLAWIWNIFKKKPDCLKCKHAMKNYRYNRYMCSKDSVTCITQTFTTCVMARYIFPYNICGRKAKYFEPKV